VATAADLIRRSLKLLGVMAAGESLRAEDSADGLTELNLLLETWANERLLVYGTRLTELLTSPNFPVSIGIDGTGDADIDTDRPLRIDAISYKENVSGSNEVPVRIITDAEFQSIPDKLARGTPRTVWIEQSYPFLGLWLHPTPSSAFRLVLYSWSRISELAASDEVSLPEGYENAIGLSLALQMAPMYGVEPSGMLVRNAETAMAAIQRTNVQPSVMRCDDAVLSRGGMNLVTGGG
jgi:hypothetical protein